MFASISAVLNMSICTSKSKKHKLSQPKFILSTNNAWLLWFCQCFNIALIGAELSTWMLSIILISLIWQSLLISKKLTFFSTITKGQLNNTKQNDVRFKNKKLESYEPTSESYHNISPLLLGAFAIAGCIAITASAQKLGILLSMVHLLSFAYVLKAFELKQRSDFYQLFLLGLFLLGSSLIFKQSLSFSLISITALIVNLAVLLQFFTSKNPIHKTLKTTTFLLVQSLLLACVLFVVFPRLSPFWIVPQVNSATTGLSDSVKPGDIAKLAQSSKLAFRVNFTQGEIPLYSQLYWRAMTLEDYDGRQWSHVKNNKNKSSLSFVPNKRSYEKLSYQVITEPSFQYWLFALAPAVSLDTSVLWLPDFTVKSRNAITQTKAYKLESYLNHPLSINISNSEKSLNLSLPENSNPRLFDLGRQLKKKHPNAQDRANSVLRQIRQQKYYYTLEPPLLSNNSLDQFYFDTKSGFCEHYASAFTFIMRASGTPARVVTGYMGGEFNGISITESSIKDDFKNNTNNRQGHLSVYQSDAHAWSEIWIEGRGWIRIDPTGAVDPERVSSGWSDDLQQQQSALNNDFINLYKLKKFGWLNELRLEFDALDYQWTRWVLGYSTSNQYDLLQRLIGQIEPWKIALIIAGAISFSALFLVVFFLYKNYKKIEVIPQSPWLIVYQNALNVLARKGLIKLPSTTSHSFLLEIKAKHPEIAFEFARVNASFIRLSYQILSTEEQESELYKLKLNYKRFKQKSKKI